MLEKRFSLEDGEFGIQKQDAYNRLEDKLRFLFKRFSLGLDLGSSAAWAQFIELKRLRDGLVHSRDEEDSTPLDDYERVCRAGLSACISLMNELSQGIFTKPLRAKLLDLAI